jgi:stage III sporulation protein AF
VIEWLGGWLKSIIMIILIATFVDLLLPNHSLQRYVKTVISLFVLMALLSPIAQLFQKTWNVDDLLKSEQQRWDLQAKTPDYLHNPAAIMSQGKTLQAIDSIQAIRLTENEIEQQVKKDLQESSGVATAGVQATIALNAQGSPQLQRIVVSIAKAELERAVPQGNRDKADPGSESSSGAGESATEPLVKPVDIHLAPILLDGASAQPVAASSKQELPPKLVKWQQQVKHSLQTKWQLGPKQIDIEIE